MKVSLTSLNPKMSNFLSSLKIKSRPASQLRHLKLLHNSLLRQLRRSLSLKSNHLQRSPRLKKRTKQMSL